MGWLRHRSPKATPLSHQALGAREFSTGTAVAAAAAAAGTSGPAGAVNSGPSSSDIASKQQLSESI